MSCTNGIQGYPFNVWGYPIIYCGYPLDNRYLGLFGDHIVPAILYRYTQELRRPDLVNRKGKPLIKNSHLKTVWTRLADRLSTVVSDTSMMTISSAYSAHFSDMYINGKENAKLTGDRMKMLMLSLPFMVRDLIAPEVFSRDIPRYPRISFYMICISLFKCRLSSSILPSMQHHTALHCTAFPTFLTQVMALWRC
jgi:hypothetical protein